MNETVACKFNPVQCNDSLVKHLTGWGLALLWYYWTVLEGMVFLGIHFFGSLLRGCALMISLPERTACGVECW
jgi:hypothetical protein